MRRRGLALLVAATVAVSACGGDDDEDATPTTLAPPTTPAPVEPDPTTPTTEATVPTTPAPDTVPPPTSAPPTTEPDPVTITDPTTAPPTTPPGEPDWVAIVQGLSDVYDELQANPDPSRIGEFCIVGDNECTIEQGGQIEALARDGWRVVGLPRTPILEAELGATVGDLPLDESPFVGIEVTIGAIDLTNAKVVDSEGEVVFDLVSDDDDQTDRGIWLIAKNDAGDWRVLSLG